MDRRRPTPGNNSTRGGNPYYDPYYATNPDPVVNPRLSNPYPLNRPSYEVPMPHEPGRVAPGAVLPPYSELDNGLNQPQAPAYNTRNTGRGTSDQYAGDFSRAGERRHERHSSQVPAQRHAPEYSRLRERRNERHSSEIPAQRHAAESSRAREGRHEHRSSRDPAFQHAPDYCRNREVWEEYEEAAMARYVLEDRPPDYISRKLHRTENACKTRWFMTVSHRPEVRHLIYRWDIFPR